MARATTPTLMPLDQYADILGLDPRHFNQMVCDAFPVTTECPSVWYQHGWQAPGRCSRDELARAIHEAESLIAQELEFFPAPTWIENERHLYPRQDAIFTETGVLYFPATRYPRRRTLTTQYGRFIRGGRRRLRRIATHGVVTRVDVDGDGWDEVVRVTIPYTNANTALTREGIAVYPPDYPEEEDYRIRDLRVRLTATQVIMQGSAAWFVDPDLWEARNAIDGDVAGNFLADVIVYYEDTYDGTEDYAPVVFEWENPCSVNLSTAYGLLQPTNTDLGFITPMPVAWDSDTSTWRNAAFIVGDEPNYARLYYRAGYGLDKEGRMAEPMASAVAALATVKLTKPFCGCENAEDRAAHWRAVPQTLSLERLNCPFGSENGAWEAWNVVSNFKELGVTQL